MPSSIVYIWLMYLLLISSLDINMARLEIPSSGPSTMGSVSSQRGAFVKLKPQPIHKPPVPRGKEAIKNCMPKGLRRTSAPSRYANYQPLGSCSTVHPEP
uniref:Uncharacterized protein MANES_04G015900 n=1 Tax=Rhizophora mucronata TaxID=61149 RepID=A0A2P2P4K3_RHIMU